MHAKVNILKDIKLVYKRSENCELNTSIFSKLRNELRLLSKQLRLTQKQSFFFSIIFCKCVSNGNIDRNDIINHLNCDSIDVIEYQADIVRLFKVGYLNKVKLRYRGQQSIMNESFKLNDNIQQAIFQNKDLNSLVELNITNAVDFVNHVFALMKQVTEDDLDFNEVHKSVKVNIKKNKCLVLK